MISEFRISFKDLKNWLEKWHLERYKNPARVDVHLSRIIRENDRVKVVLYSIDDFKLKKEKPRLVLFDEILSFDTAQKLRLTTQLLADIQGISIKESLAYMVYILLVVEDYKRNELNIKSIESSLLSGVIHVLPENENKFRRFRTTQIVPVYSLESLLDFWQSYGFTLTRGVYEKPDHSYFMPSYLTIPMHWLTLEEVEEKEGKLNRDIPIYVKTYNYAKVNHINKEIQSGKEVGINIEIRDSEKIQPKENKEESNLGFKHSPDYRSLNLRGNLYKLTSRQAEVIQLLHEAHENETPSLGQDYILTKIGSKYSKLKDVFRSNPKVWKEIITTEGERRGSYRLNI